VWTHLLESSHQLCLLGREQWREWVLIVTRGKYLCLGWLLAGVLSSSPLLLSVWGLAFAESRSSVFLLGLGTVVASYCVFGLTCLMVFLRNWALIPAQVLLVICGLVLSWFGFRNGAFFAFEGWLGVNAVVVTLAVPFALLARSRPVTPDSG
jgi:hypothetical protein